MLTELFVLFCVSSLYASSSGLSDLSDALILERNGATVILSGLPECSEVNPPGFWVFDSPDYPNLANPQFYGKCLCLMHGPNPSYYPPPPWRSDAVGVVEWKELDIALPIRQI
eukprot:NODE_7787_length_741_cov_69.189320_g7173_i0.p1 GENE.NODE_7787_length_741_cov_69.189320_g7173_i0~~NODE_7787_length_741_cov_69.189320_g7173_i0.p1  ORF type:complete len:113 (-),score=21.71 NODE_7787_length_741_cov_69.189320_g7173_i0:347-685(-)